MNSRRAPVALGWLRNIKNYRYPGEYQNAANDQVPNENLQPENCKFVTQLQNPHPIFSQLFMVV